MAIRLHPDPNFSLRSSNDIAWGRIRTTAADDYFDQHVTRAGTIAQKTYGFFFYLLKHWNWISQLYHWAVGTDATLYHLKITAKNLVDVFSKMDSSQEKCDCFFQGSRKVLLKENPCPLSRAWDEFCDAFTQRCSHLQISLYSDCSIGFDNKCVEELSQKLAHLCQETGSKVTTNKLTNWMQETIRRKLFQNRWYQLAWINPDIHIQIIPRLDPRDIVSLSCVSKRLNQDISICLAKISDVALLKICRNLTIIDTASGSKPPTDYFEVVKGAYVFDPLIEKDSGLTLLIVREGLTLARAEQVGNIKVRVADKLLDWYSHCYKYAELPVEKTHSFLITDKFLKGSDTMSHEERLQLANQHGCEKWSLLAMVALYIFTFQTKGIYLYKDQNDRNTISYTFFYSKAIFLSVNGYEPDKLWIFGHTLLNDFPNATIRGVRGLRRIDRIDHTPV